MNPKDILLGALYKHSSYPELTYFGIAKTPRRGKNSKLSQYKTFIIFSGHLKGVIVHLPRKNNKGDMKFWRGFSLL